MLPGTRFCGGGEVDFVRAAFFLGAVDFVRNRYVGMDVKSAALVRVGSLILYKFEGGVVVMDSRFCNRLTCCKAWTVDFVVG